MDKKYWYVIGGILILAVAIIAYSMLNSDNVGAKIIKKPLQKPVPIGSPFVEGNSTRLGGYNSVMETDGGKDPLTPGYVETYSGGNVRNWDSCSGSDLNEFWIGNSTNPNFVWEKWLTQYFCVRGCNTVYNPSIGSDIGYCNP